VKKTGQNRQNQPDINILQYSLKLKQKETI